jgi:hypothetical protein
MQTPPYIPPELIDWLAGLYPDRCPDTSMSEREIWMSAGAAALIRRLRLEHARQSSNLLETR